MENKISVIDIAEERASINDIKFGWKMIMVNHFGNGKPLAVVFDALNVEYPTFTLNDSEYKEFIASPKWAELKEKLKEIHPSITDLGKAELKKRNYDRFVIFGHLDEVGNLTNAIKYFRDHQVRDVDANALFEEAIASGNIPAEEVERLRK